MRTDYWQKLEEGGIYHIYNRAVGKDDLFSNEGNYAYFLKQWKKYLPYLDVFCYCLIPNHFHFLAKVKPLSETLLEHIKSQATVKSRKFINKEISYYNIWKTNSSASSAVMRWLIINSRVEPVRCFKNGSKGFGLAMITNCSIYWPIFTIIQFTINFAMPMVFGRIARGMLT